MADVCRSASEALPGIGRAALVVGHPGHELKVFGWALASQPLVFVLTNGSGRNGVSRVASTAQLLTSLGASPGEIFGNLTDAELYSAILEQDVPIFLRLLDSLAASLLKHKIDGVVGDAAEGFNPTHDLCRCFINSAVLLVNRATGKKLKNFEVSLTEWEQGCPQPRHDDRCLHWFLDDSVLARKIAAAEQYVELKTEVQRALAQRGEKYFRLECLRRVEKLDPESLTDDKPLYEVWGEQRVAAGLYQNVIRFKQHILPLMKAIFAYADQGAGIATLGCQRIEHFASGGN